MSAFCRLMFALGAAGMLSGVGLGAFAAHGLRAVLPAAALAAFRTGVEYQIYHALGLLAIGAIAAHGGDRRVLRWAGGLMAAGILLFSGSLYAMALAAGGPVRWELGAPFGGSAWLVAWLLVIVTALTARPPRPAAVAGGG